jgi:hypothetical protein
MHGKIIGAGSANDIRIEVLLCSHNSNANIHLPSSSVFRESSHSINHPLLHVSSYMCSYMHSDSLTNIYYSNNTSANNEKGI